jgi:hypothetical protein
LAATKRTIESLLILETGIVLISACCTVYIPVSGRKKWTMIRLMPSANGLSLPSLPALPAAAAVAAVVKDHTMVRDGTVARLRVVGVGGLPHDYIVFFG